MPRQYERKPESRPYLTNYLSHSMQQAIQAIKGGATYYQSAKKFNVPKSTATGCSCKLCTRRTQIVHKLKNYL